MKPCTGVAPVVALVVALIGLAASRPALADDLAPIAADPSSHAFLPVPAVDVVFEASQTDRRLSGRVGVVWSDRLALEAKLSAPVSETGDTSTVATLDGLDDGTSVELAVAYIHWNPTEDTRATDAVCAKANAKAIADLEQKIAEHQAPAFACSVTSLPEAMQAEFMARDQAGREAMCVAHRTKLSNDELDELRAQLAALGAGPGATPGAPRPCVRSALPPALRSEFDRAVSYGVPVIVGLRAKVDTREVEFVAGRTFKPAEATIADVSLGLFAGVVLDRIGTLSALVRWERSYDEGDKATICFPGTAPDSLVCDERSLGEPVRTDRLIAALSYQRTIAGAIGLAARVGIDLEHSTALAELPIFFLRPGDSSFTGGVVLAGSYNQDDGFERTATVFLGGRFDVMGVNTTW